MSYDERATVFECAGDQLVGIVTVPSKAAVRLGVLVIVGGPQYRVGSHRQFVLLSRALAERGIPCMRFDYRGMGDTGGEARAFSSVDDDIRAAVDTFHETVGGLDGIVLWGLCDGASAACFYAPRDPRVTAAVLLNPWVRTEATAAKVYIEKYYARRFLQPAFWKKLLGGGVAIGKSLRELLSAVRTASKGRSRTSATLPLPQRMASDLGEARRPLLVILSGNDFVANEFEQVAATDARWSHLLANATVEKLEAADHTFSTAAWRDHVARTTGDWVIALARNGSQRSHSRS